MADERIVVLAEFQNQVEAELARSLLATNGVTCELTDIRTQNLVGGVYTIKLRVAESALDRARSILAEARATPTEEDPRFELVRDRLAGRRALLTRVFLTVVVAGLVLAVGIAFYQRHAASP